MRLFHVYMVVEVHNTAQSGVDAIDSTHLSGGPDEDSVNGNQVGENAQDGLVKNSCGRSKDEATIIADELRYSNTDAGTVPASVDGWYGNRTRVNRVMTIRNEWFEHIYYRSRR